MLNFASIFYNQMILKYVSAYRLKEELANKRISTIQ